MRAVSLEFRLPLTIVPVVTFLALVSVVALVLVLVLAFVSGEFALTVRPKTHSELIPRARKIEFESCK